MRLFIAVELPPDVTSMLAGLRGDIPGARWVPREQLHLTLAFLGEVADETCEVLVKLLAGIRLPAFELRFDGVGCFPDRRRPRVIWVGLEREPILTELAERVRRVVRDSGIPQEERPFAAHITLARCRFPAAREVGVYLDRYRQPALPAVSVREFVLFRSELTAQGAIHTPLVRVPLQAADQGAAIRP